MSLFAELDQQSFIQNNGLFSSYYLQHLHEFHEEISRMPSHDVEELFNETYNLYEKVKSYINISSEAQVEDEFIKPVLKNILGHHFDPQFEYQRDKPDFIFFESDVALERNKTIRKSNPKEYLNNALAVGDAKAWHGKGYSRIDSNKVPLQQIHGYLQNFTLRWGFITNGQYWYLFCHNEGIRQDQYLKIDLLSMLTAPDQNFTKADHPFRTFLFFFGLDAFKREANGLSRLDKVLEGVRKRTQGIQDNLKLQVYHALSELVTDIARMNELDIRQESVRVELKENAMVLLYRILFLLYAEGRNILPVVVRSGNKNNYLPYSLQTLKEQIIKDNEPLVNGAQYWKHLKVLFSLVHGLDRNGKERPLNAEIPIKPYNGGLFDIDHWPKLKDWEIGDKALVKVLLELATVPQEGSEESMFFRDRASIDYRDLSIQHLGNIYEGILENKLIVDGEGCLIVVDDDDERRFTGSYYTPDFIVDYIIAKTLTDLTDEKNTQEEILQLAVLDPAMGSGHFLIGAIDFLAVRIAAMQGEYTIEELQAARRVVAERCIYGVDVNPIAVELARLAIWLHTVSPDKPLTFLDHQIKCGNSLLGAKISELGTLPPIRNRAGRIVNANTDEIKFYDSFEEDTKSWLTAGIVFTNQSNTINDVKEKEKLEVTQQNQKEIYRKIANYWLSRYFVTERDPEKERITLSQLSSRLRYPESQFSTEVSVFLEESQDIAKFRKFFHWEIEFPQAFFDSFGVSKCEGAGFDAVIGNPPYIKQERLGAVKKMYFQYAYESYANGADIYVYFYELAYKLLKKDHILGFISSNKFIRSKYGIPLCSFLPSNFVFEHIIDFGELPVFEEAATFPIIIIGRKENSAGIQNFSFTKIKSLDFTNYKIPLNLIEDEFAIIYDASSVSGENWTLEPPVVNKLLAKLFNQSLSFGNYTDDEIYYGLKTGYNNAFIINQSKYDALVEADIKSSEIIFPMVIGDDLRRYIPEYRAHFMIVTPIGVDINRYPAIYNHLLFYKEKLQARNDQGEHWWELRSCDYYDKMSMPKIVWGAFMLGPKFALDEGRVVNNPAYFYPKKDLFLLALLNSKLLFRVLGIICSVFGDAEDGGRIVIRTAYIKRLPIKQLKSETRDLEREKIILVSLQKVFNQDIKDIHKIINASKDLLLNAEGSFKYIIEFITEKIIALYKEKQSTINIFKEWWADYQLPPIESLSPLSTMDEYWTKEFTEILVHLRRNRHEVSIQIEDNLKARFSNSKNEILKTVSIVQSLEDLIDKLVYELYGLTEEEMKLVEGAV